MTLDLTQDYTAHLIENELGETLHLIHHAKTGKAYFALPVFANGDLSHWHQFELTDEMIDELQKFIRQIKR